MQTEPLDERIVDIPWLEYHRNDGSIPQRTAVSSFPFVIGRSESADLRINSTLVSRKHATIIRHGDRYCVKDAGSTNGTVLNGKKVDEATIADADVLTIANIEFTFHCGSLHPFEHATKVMPVDSRGGDRPGDAEELIVGVRRLQEMILHGAVHCEFESVFCPHEQNVVGYTLTGLATERVAETPDIVRRITRTSGLLMRRLRQLLRRLAIEQKRNGPPGGQVFLPFVACELVRDALVGELASLRDAVDTPEQIVVQVPVNVTNELPGFSRMYQAVRQLDLAVAYEDFAGGQSQAHDMAKLTPDFVKLAPSAIRGIGQSRERQRRMRLLLQSFSELGCDVIAVGIENDREVEVVSGLGCRLVQRSGCTFASQAKNGGVRRTCGGGSFSSSG